MRQRSATAVVVLGTAVDGRVHLVANVAPAAVERGVKAGDVVRAAAEVAGGGGGGRDTMAQAGGRDPEKLPEALADGAAAIEQALRADARILALDHGVGPLRLRDLGPHRHARHAARVGGAAGHASAGLAALAPAGARSAGPSCVVVGLPLTLAGRGGRAGAGAPATFAERLERRLSSRGAARRAPHDAARRAHRGTGTTPTRARPPTCSRATWPERAGPRA